MAWYLAKRINQLSPIGINQVTLQGNSYVIVAIDHGYACFVDKCTHQDVKLSDFGELVETRIICHAHGGQFCARDGEPLCFPAKRSLKQLPLEVRGDEIYIQIDITYDAKEPT